MIFKDILKKWEEIYRPKTISTPQNKDKFNKIWEHFFNLLDKIEVPENLTLIATGAWFFGKLKRNLQCRFRLAKAIDNKEFNLMVWLDLGKTKSLYENKFSKNYVLGFHIGVDLNRRGQDKTYEKYESEIFEERKKLFSKYKNKHDKFDFLIVKDYCIFAVSDKDANRVSLEDINKLLVDLGIILNRLHSKFYVNSYKKKKRTKTKKLND